MKINSNGYAHRILAAGGFAVLAACALPAGRLRRALLIYGGLILAGFCLLLCVELTQDKRLHAFYRARRDTKLRLGNGAYECQACGSQQVRQRDTFCPVCGTAFSEKLPKG